MSINWTGESEPGFPYWWEALRGITAPDDALPGRCDLLVIGAGYTGLSAALAAHECGARVAVVDADVPGVGASSRNGGMFGAHPRLGWEELSRKFGAATADALFAEAQPSLDWARALIASEGIDCDLQETGRIQLAWSARDFEHQKQLARTVTTKSTVKAEIVPREAMIREIATEKYFGGLMFPAHCGLHPARFHYGLLNAVRKRGIPVTPHAGVHELERGPTGFKARTARGTVHASKVVLATGGYTTAPFRWHAARVFPLPSYLIATQELPADLIDRIAPGRRMMVETRARHSYFRVSPDGRRILFGGRASMRQIDITAAATRLHQTMCEVWPELRDVKLSHAWCGNTGYSFTHMPHVGSDGGLHYAMGFSGSGTVMAPYLGAKAAYQAMGDPRGETAYSATPLRRSWMHPGARPHFLHAADLWYRTYMDWADLRKGR